MKAYVLRKYGPPEELELTEVEKPVPAAHEVLIKVRATAINDYDWSMVRGRPYPYRLLYGIFKPKHQVPGMEVAGTIAELGPNTGLFEFGDEVYGDTSSYGFGCFAEYVCVNEKALTLKPKGMSFEEAASIPHASMLAVQGLIDIGQIQQGQSVLINGAGGGVGTFGLQIAKLFEAKVTGVDTGSKLQLMEALGYDHVIDYRNEDFTRNGKRYDLILDCKTTRSPFDYARSLSPGGRYVTVGGVTSRIMQVLLSGPIVSAFLGKHAQLLALKPNKDIGYVNRLFEEGRIRCIIDGPYQLSEIPELIRYFGEGKHTGKVVIVLPP